MHCGPPNQNFGWALAHPAYPVAPPWVLVDAVSFLSGVRGGAPTAVAFCCIECFQNASGRSIVWFFGQHCNEWQNESQSRLRSNLLSAGNLRYINIIHSHSNWQVNFCKVRNCGPPKFCGPVRLNTSNMPKAGPVR